MKPYLTHKDPTIRNEDGKWINTSVFRQEAIKFERTGGVNRSGYYCADPIDTPAYNEYWDEQLRRCIEGYEVGGHKITGHHYEYLNFSRIMSVDMKKGGGKTTKKINKPPDFWDGDFDFFWCLEIAKSGVANDGSLLTTPEQRLFINSLGELEQKQVWVEIVDDLKMHVKPHPDYLDGGYHFIVGKSRRKGYSYKNAAICANIYNTVKESLTVIGAFDKKYLYPKGTMGMASNYLSFLNKHTAWFKAREYVDKQEHKRASFKETNQLSGVGVEAGYMSDIMAVTFKDNPDAARGKDALYVLLEEAGKFPNLKASYEATQPGLEAGEFVTGQIIIFGTGGDMEVGTVDFAEMFYNPIQFGLMPFVNIWDKNAENSVCGFFHPVYMNMEGYYDEQGNSDIEGATAAELAKRERIKKHSTSSLVIQKRVQEHPLSPSEAFLTVSLNDFPIVELREQFNKVMANKFHIKFGQPVRLEPYYVKEQKDGQDIQVRKIRAIPDLDGIIEPIWDFQPKSNDLRGGVVIYEHPIFNPPKGLYKIGFDPYRQQSSSASKPSLAAIYVYKANHKFSYSRDTIVAQYVGRPYHPDDVNKIAEMLAELYNAEIMHENEVTHVKGYFEKKKKLHLLAAQPEAVISANIKKSKVARIYGIHMIDKLKDAGEKYIKSWLLEERDFDEDGNVVLNLHTIYDPALLEELIQYNRKGNFDRVMAFMMVMFQCEEDAETEYAEQDDKTSNAHDLLAMMNKQFQKN